jgi:hypothetical protein
LTKNGSNSNNKAVAAIAAVAWAGFAAAQAPSTRRIEVTVTEPSGRFVTGLEREDFEVIENGVRRVITRFAAAQLPISLAVVSKERLPAMDIPGAADLIQTTSLSDALRQLAASPHSRKAIVTTAEAPMATGIPPEIELVTVAPDGVAKAVAELRNQYRLEFESDPTLGGSRSRGQREARTSSPESELEVIP